MNRFVSFSTSPAYVQQYNEVQKQMKEMLDNKNKAQHVHFEEPAPTQITPIMQTQSQQSSSSSPTSSPAPSLQSLSQQTPATESTPAETTKEGYCDEHFHSVSVAVVVIIIVIFFAFIIQLFSCGVKIKPVEPPLADDEIY